MIVGGIVMSFVMDRTYFGRYVFALGGNEAAARLAGINVKRMKYAIGCVAGFFCGIGAVILTSRVGAAAAGTEITILTGVLVGGVSARGGDGKIANCIAGVLIMGLLANGMQLAGTEYLLSVYRQGCYHAARHVVRCIPDQTQGNRSQQTQRGTGILNGWTEPGR